MSPDPLLSDVARVARMMLVTEACASVALSHEGDCGCVICLAASGEPRAVEWMTDQVERLGWEPPI
jgi:hypothetical protein